MWRFICAWFVYTWGGLHRYFGNQNNMPSEHERAVHYFTRAYHIDPTFRGARRERATLLWRELGRPLEALADFDALLEENPADASALLNRGLLFQEIGRYQDALNDIEAYLRLPEEDSYQAEATRIAHFLRQIVSDSQLD